MGAGVLNTTLTFFTSDNGPWLVRGLAGGSAGLLRDGKQTTWEVRSPMRTGPCTLNAVRLLSLDVESRASALAPPPCVPGEAYLASTCPQGGVREPGLVSWPGTIEARDLAQSRTMVAISGDLGDLRRSRAISGDLGRSRAVVPCPGAE